MLKRKKPYSTPVVGWTYEVAFEKKYKLGTAGPKGITRTKIEGLDFIDLVENVRRTLIRNGETPPENLAEIIEHDICLRSPRYACYGTLEEGDPQPGWPSMEDIEAGTRTIGEVVRNAMISEQGESLNPFVSKQEAARRASICVGCRFNKNYWGCFACKAAAEFAQKNFSLSTDHDQYLAACLVCKCVNRLQVHVKGEILARHSAHEEAEYPDHCWKKEILSHAGKAD